MSAQTQSRDKYTQEAFINWVKTYNLEQINPDSPEWVGLLDTVQERVTEDYKVAQLEGSEDAHEFILTADDDDFEYAVWVAMYVTNEAQRKYFDYRRSLMKSWSCFRRAESGKKRYLKNLENRMWDVEGTMSSNVKARANKITPRWVKIRGWDY